MWEILGISATSDLKKIKRAYAIALRKLNPQEQPAEFQQLKRAFDQAMNWAKQHPDFAAEQVVENQAASGTVNESIKEDDAKEETVEDKPADLKPDSGLASLEAENSSDSSLDWNFYKAGTDSHLSPEPEKPTDSSFNWTLGKEIPEFENSEVISDDDFDLVPEGPILLEKLAQEVSDDWVLPEEAAETEPADGRHFQGAKTENPNEAETAKATATKKTAEQISLAVCAKYRFSNSSLYLHRITKHGLY